MGHADETTFESFVAATGNQTFRTALLLCGDWHLAEDLTQTTFAKVFAGWPRYGPRRQPARVPGGDCPGEHLPVAPAAAAAAPRRRPRPCPDPRALPGTEPQHPDGPARRGSRLAVAHRPAVLVLRYWEDRSIAQTAQDLGLSEGAVRTRTTRAAQRLRDVLDADFPDVVKDRARA